MAVLDLALDSRLFLESILDCALQELDLIFNTENTELIGNVRFGSNFEQFLWQSTPSPDSLKDYIYQLMSSSLFLSMVEKNVVVNVIDGEFRSIYIVQISLTYNGETDTRNYQLQ